MPRLNLVLGTVGCAAAVGAAQPASLHAQWFGWDYACVSSTLRTCASAQIRAVPGADGRTLLAVRLQAHTPGYWSAQSGTAIGLIFRSDLAPATAGPGPSPTWIPWTYGPYSSSLWMNAWTLDVRAVTQPPVYGMGWVTFTVDAPFTIADEDLIGFFTETNPLVPFPDGSGYYYTTNQIALTSPTYITPEPITLVLLGTGLTGVGGFAGLRRRRPDKVAGQY